MSTSLFPSSGVPVTNFLVGSAGFIVAYLLILGIYRLYFHPLSKFPGSPWAALSSWYEVYWNVYNPGALVFELERLHKRYGPVVRIAPNELHVNSPDFKSQIYKPSGQFRKQKYHYDAFCIPESLAGLTDHDTLRVRREALRPLFHRKVVENVWPEMNSKIGRLFKTIEQKKEPIAIGDAIACFTLDVIAEMSFSADFGAVDDPTFLPAFHVQARDAQRTLWVLKLFPWLRKITVTASSLVQKSKIQTAIVVVLQTVEGMIDEYAYKSKNNLDDKPYPNAIEHLMSPTAARKWVVPDRRTLTMESLTLLAGGTETVAMAVMVGMYHICTKPEILERLRRELDDAFPDKSYQPTWQEFESVPYLSAVCKEIYRYAAPVPGRLPRIVPDTGATIEDKFIPPGTVVGMSAYLLHRNEEVFPRGSSFIPERWLDKNSSTQERNLFSFAKGAGQCLGQNLAWAEVYMLVGSFFRQFDVQLVNASPECVEWRDQVVCYFPGPQLKANFVPRKA